MVVERILNVNSFPRISPIVFPDVNAVNRERVPLKDRTRKGPFGINMHSCPYAERPALTRAGPPTLDM
jgi:hypothetical protein